MKGQQRRRVLVLYWNPEAAELRATVGRHLKVLESATLKHEITYFNSVTPAAGWLRHSCFDAIVLHTTFLCMRWSHLFYTWKWGWRWIADAHCPKIALPQDEYDHSEILDEWLYELGATDIFSNFDSSQRGVLYPIMSKRGRFHKCLTGYVDEVAARICAEKHVPPAKRPCDIVYRATRLPYWFGSHGQRKHQVGVAVAERATALGLKADISTAVGDTIVGDRWFDFLMSGRAVIGCESGSSVLDRRGEVRANVQRMLGQERGLSFDEVSRRMPTGWDRYQFFAISPRHFEAVITRTCQVLVEGTYDGILEPGRHYVPLRRDLSDLEDALHQVTDVKFVEDIVTRAYEDIYLSGQYGYRSFAQDIERVLLSYPPDARSLGRGRTRVALLGAKGVAVLGRYADLTGKADLAARFLRSPGGAIAKGLLVMHQTLRDPTLRRLLIAYVRDRQLRQAIKLGDLLADLLRLSIFRYIMSGRNSHEIGFRIESRYESAQGILTILSFSADPRFEAGPADRNALEDLGGEIGRRPLSRILWDHSAIGVSMPCLASRQRPFSIHMGPSGVYEFAAIGALGARHLECVWRALSPPVNATVDFS